MKNTKKRKEKKENKTQIFVHKLDFQPNLTPVIEALSRKHIKLQLEEYIDHFINYMHLYEIFLNFTCAFKQQHFKFLYKCFSNAALSMKIIFMHSK